MSIVINSPEDRTTIYNKLKEIGNSLSRKKDETAHIKDIVDELHEQFPDISKKQFRKAAKILHEQTFETERLDFAELESLYTNVIGGTANG